MKQVLNDFLLFIGHLLYHLIHRSANMPGSPIIQGGIFAVGLAVGVGTASLLLKKQQSAAPTAVAVPTPIPVPSAPYSPAARAPAPIFGDAAGLRMDPAVGSEVAREVFKYGFPGAFCERGTRRRADGV